MKRHSIMVQMLWKVSLYLGLVALITFIIGYFLINSRIGQHEEQYVDSASNTVLSAMETTQNATESIERMIELRLHTASKGIMSDLEGRTAEDISAEELEELSDAWDVQHISLWEREGDFIEVTKSSDSTQLGITSQDWGYWHEAFHQLMDQEPVEVEEGFALENFWVGPISRAELFKHIYYKFAYYYDGSTDFMINPYIEDQEIYNVTFESGPSEVISKITTENKMIEEVAVVNVGAWMEGEDHEVIEPEEDLPVLYGHSTIQMEEESHLLETALESGSEQRVNYDSEGESYEKIYKPLENDRVMTMVLNLQSQNELKNSLLVLFIGSVLFALLALFIIVRLVTKRQLKPLNVVSEHLEKVANGDLSKEITFNERNEFDWLGEQINDLTSHFRNLIKDLKEQSQSLLVVSNLLSQQVQSSVKTMTTSATSVTADTRNVEYELETLSQKVEQIKEKLKQHSQTEVSEVREATEEVAQNLSQMSEMMNAHSADVSEITIVFYDTLYELDQALERMDRLSTDLNQKIDYFKVE
ncbi:HAMP domain-containing protein [Halalkalibacillus halophilus]|uniref:HAMP domain-containing protein n=1 Tax=Halalkalibacillus halophilus TaxID=392827 RepID=UPI00047FE332|nr:methyl-accepting chemotaxis protein [Halalkalibacillus halophilus]